ncbi:ferric reductase like protein [Aliiruegeria haliotis]|uniref:Ferric reductase like protein n=1 Tax=Aliiruegeria haliotis TaxID=1280846 RepID=A0A2T0RYR0_9RHOB|nr:ferric reductase-like transmembrane domain-containing protein [Aliiruegeria haliotis]PRY26326.1 ferric reductase like protein [Aliiruegeria haliotis]
MIPARRILTWLAVAVAVVVPVALAATSPLLQWRDPVYIAAGFAGIGAMALLLLQPLLAGGVLPGMRPIQNRRWHRRVGVLIILATAVHVAGLWMTSPPDVVDALLFRSPTPFSVWGVLAMWALLGAALLAGLRRRLRWRWRIWRLAHTSLAIVVVTGSVVHALRIEGTMETWSKAVLCGLVLAATARTMIALRIWAVGPVQPKE